MNESKEIELARIFTELDIVLRSLQNRQFLTHFTPGFCHDTLNNDVCHDTFNYDLLGDRKFGFRSLHSTALALSKVTNT